MKPRNGNFGGFEFWLEDRKAATARFAREAEVLSELHHPGIVRYVAHGRTEPGRPFLAMEWLDGEDLAARDECDLLAVG